eukprot:CAMPEP_0197197494 /NCGR_PEP_ID=MMETSP1423-20130617/32897_1 /TAXON_ID=476441 /ORGANISM="Pseudo-nitzschia heimii, Strain UNC1101" /LENGTH=1093 /DNA_ID=CAMNT_0042651317 /DNA_START=69 /DNA_END=3350 /DNA_ORIENTATION=+
MWGASFNDLAKKAQEMQEQAAASIASTPTSSSFNMGGVFNMDTLQQKDEKKPDSKTDDLKKLAQQAMSQAKADAEIKTASTFYNPLAMAATGPQKTQQPLQLQQKKPSTKKLQMPQSVSKGSVMAVTKTTNSNSNQQTQQQPKATVGSNLNPKQPSSFGTAKPKPVGSPARKGKLAVPTNKTKPATAPRPVVPTTKSTIPSGSNALKIRPPASSPATPSGAKKAITNNNNNKNKSVVAATPAVKIKEKPTKGTKQSQPMGQTPKATTTPKLVAPKSVPKQQQQTPVSAPKGPAQPKDSLQPKQQQQQQKQALRSATQQQAAAPARAPTAEKPPATKAQSSKPNNPQTQQQKSAAPDAPIAVSKTAAPKKGGNATTKGPVPAASSKPTPAPATPATTTTASTKGTPAKSSDGASAVESDPTAETNQRDSANSSSQNDEGKTNDPDEEDLRGKLQEQREAFERQLEEQRQVADARMRQLQDQFSEQFQRLEEHNRHETKQAATQREAAVANWQQQVRDREMLLEAQSQQAESKEADSQATIENLSKQLKQARELIKDKEKEDRRLQEAHLQQLRNMEKQCFKKEDASTSLTKEIQDLKKQLEESKKETQTARDDHDKLKERAKTVAGELRERRAECRTLSSEIDLLKDAKGSLQERITHLEAKGMDMNQSSEETQAKLASLRSSLDESKRELSEAKHALDTEKSRAEEAMSNYKKKAQQSLALANARSAAAVQAREEAEMEARAARAISDTAMERSMKAELNGKQALAEAKVYVENMKGEVEKYEVVKAELEKTSREWKRAQAEAEANKDSNEQLRCELTSISGRLEAEQANLKDTKENLASAHDRSNELYEEVERLRQAMKSQKEEIKRLIEAKKSADTSLPEDQAPAIVRSANAEAEATIAMLRQELQDSNKAIKELKETVKATMEEKASGETGGYSNGGNVAMNGNHSQPENGMPLFYAMEKQAELTQARDEITRMANLLGDAESAKQSALDDMDEMRQRMEDAYSKLQRQEQLQAKVPGKQQSTNVEYLKNIVLSYLNAETTEERKALLPVIGTVLCLTPAEYKMATDQLDKGGGSVMDSVTSSVLGFKWS